MERFAQRKSVLVQADASCFGQRGHVLRRLQADREHQDVESAFN